MEIIQINSNIFPLVFSLQIGNKENTKYEKIDLPRDASHLYLKSITDDTEKTLLKKYAKKILLSDEEYKSLFELFLNRNTVSESLDSNGDIKSFLKYYGIKIEAEENGDIQFKNDKGNLDNIRADTWEYITLDLLREKYTSVIKNYDFGNISINLGPWKTTSNEKEQALLTTFRCAFFFTLISFIYGDDSKLYNDFDSYFRNEFDKRVSFIYSNWRNLNEDEIIKYIPIYDSFYNLKGQQPDQLIKIIHSVLNDDYLIQDEKTRIKNRLIDGATLVHSNTDSVSIALEQQLIKPVVNFIIELTLADECLTAAKTLFNQNFYDASINRSYYSMMHALKALLEKEQKLSDWTHGELNVAENHKNLERKLEKLENEGVIDSQFVSDFKYVKQKRWIADYNVVVFNDAECKKCIQNAENFVNEVKQITL